MKHPQLGETRLRTETVKIHHEDTGLAASFFAYVNRNRETGEIDSIGFDHKKKEADNTFDRILDAIAKGLTAIVRKE